MAARERRGPLRSTATLPPDLVVNADPVRPHQVAGSLVGNALARTPAGWTISVRAGQQDGLAEVAVAATGGGGLGLAVARRLVTAYGRTVAVRSKPRTRLDLRRPVVAAGGMYRLDAHSGSS